MIVSPNTQPVTGIVLAEIIIDPISGAKGIMLTEIDRALLLCNACGTRNCTIDYWIRDKETADDRRQTAAE